MKESIGRTVFYVNHGYYTPKQAVGYNILRFAGLFNLPIPTCDL